MTTNVDLDFYPCEDEVYPTECICRWNRVQVEKKMDKNYEQFFRFENMEDLVKVRKNLAFFQTDQ